MARIDDDDTESIDPDAFEDQEVTQDQPAIEVDVPGMLFKGGIITNWNMELIHQCVGPIRLAFDKHEPIMEVSELHNAFNELPDEKRMDCALKWPLQYEAAIRVMRDMLDDPWSHRELFLRFADIIEETFDFEIEEVQLIRDEVLDGFRARFFLERIFEGKRARVEIIGDDIGIVLGWGSRQRTLFIKKS